MAREAPRMKAWKLDLWIALAALIVSGLTASAAIYQSKVFSDQLSATVWPYLSFVDTAGPASLDLSVENDGAGPAIIAGAQATIAGKNVYSITRALQEFQVRRGSRSHYSVTTGSIGPGQVIRPGASATILKLSRLPPDVVARLRTMYPQVAVSVYYCSLLNRCWVVRLHATDRPQEVTGQNYPHTTIQSE